LPLEVNEQARVEGRRPSPLLAPAVEIAGVTHVGRLRKRNEDAIDWDARLGVAMIADGMGGSQGGDVASRTALQSIKDDLRRAFADATRHGSRAHTREVRGALVVELVRRANQGVRKSASRDNRLHGMGTTLVMALVGPGFLTVAHVGDSRLYRVRDAQIERLTDDHSVVQELVDRGQMSASQAARSRHRNVITRAIGKSQDVTVDVAHHPIAAGDVFMLCSDGLTNMLSDTAIAAALAAHRHDLHAAARNAVDSANESGGRDNVSVVLIRVMDEHHG
jgi:PPM family protein phosphatase